MPTYEYECKACGNQFSVTKSVEKHAREKVRCPKCDSKDVKQVIEPVFVTTSKKS